MVLLVTSDNEQFVVDKEVAELSETPEQAEAEARATDRDAKDDVGYDIEQDVPGVVLDQGIDK